MMRPHPDSPVNPRLIRFSTYAALSERKLSKAETKRRSNALLKKMARLSSRIKLCTDQTALAKLMSLQSQLVAELQVLRMMSS